MLVGRRAGRTISQIFLFVHQPVAEHTVLDGLGRETGGVAESQVGRGSIGAQATLDRIGQRGTCHLARAAQGHFLGRETEHAGRQRITQVIWTKSASARDQSYACPGPDIDPT